MYKVSHKSACLDEPPYNSDLRLCEKIVPDFIESALNFSLSWQLVTIDAVNSTQNDQFLLEKGAKLGHTAGKLRSHILLYLLPRLHPLDLVHFTFLIKRV